MTAEVALIITAAVTALSLILSAERLLKSNNRPPWGLIWFSAFSIYIIAPSIIAAVARISIFSNIDILHEQIIRNRLDATGLLCVGFSIGYLMIAIMRKMMGRSAPGTLERRSRGSAFTYTSNKYFVSFCGLTCIAAFLVLNALDSFDRYNTWAAGSQIAMLFRALKIEGLTLYGFVFGLTGAVLRLDLISKRGIARIRNGFPARTILIMAAVETMAIALLVAKTGSRSMIAGCLITALLSYIVHCQISLRSILTVSLASLIMVPVAVSVFETIRIARSDHNFYRANPVHMALRVSSSMQAMPDINSLAINNRREEYNDIAFLSTSSCREVLNERMGDLTRSQIQRLTNCSSGLLEEYKASNPMLANNYLSKFLRAFNDSDRYRALNNWQVKLGTVLGRSTESISRGESINLSGDLYLRGGLQNVLFGGVFLGASYCSISLVIQLLTQEIANPAVKSLLYIIPLGMTSGSLLLPIDGQAWLLTTQLPKTVAIAIGIGVIASSLRTQGIKKNMLTRILNK